MRIKRYFFLPVLILLLVLLAACSDFDEMKGQRLYNEAQALLEDGDELSAEALLVELAASYPGTQAARAGEQDLRKIRRMRELRERREFAKVLDSYKQVLDGYQSIYATYPRTAQEFDESGYFFDIEYLAEITTEGFQVFLWLSGDDAGFRAWSVKDDIARGYAIDGQKRGLMATPREELLAMIEDRFQVVQKKGSLSLIEPRP